MLRKFLLNTVKVTGGALKLIELAKRRMLRSGGGNIKCRYPWYENALPMQERNWWNFSGG
jgi:hypothetical protein